MTPLEQSRKRRKQWKRSIARAQRITSEGGIEPLSIACPHCGSPPDSMKVRGTCRTPKGSPLHYPAQHQARLLEAEALQTKILEEGRRAKALLEGEQS